MGKICRMSSKFDIFVTEWVENKDLITKLNQNDRTDPGHLFRGFPQSHTDYFGVFEGVKG